MREKDLITTIKRVLKSDYIGDDCAYLKDLEIVVTQDSLVEDVHFSLKYMNAFQLGYKSVMVNVSDICASGGCPKYLTVALSLPADIDNDFVKEFYRGAKSACGNSIEIVGGDITGADKVYVSVCAIGSAMGRKISSRKNAKIGYKVILVGLHGLSAAGLDLLNKGLKCPEQFIKAHLEPQAQIEFCRHVGENIDKDYAMMDTSDGLMDALSTIANDSDVLLQIDFDKIPCDKDLRKFPNWQDLVLFGGEDYGIVAVVPEDFEIDGSVIGKVSKGLGVELKINGKYIQYSKKDVEEKVFKHFSEDL